MRNRPDRPNRPRYERFRGALVLLILVAPAAASAEPPFGAGTSAGNHAAGSAASRASLPTTFSIGADGGVLWGMATELVYVGSYKLSELDYPLQPMVFAGGRMDVGAFGGLEASVRFRGGIPTRTGSMTDSDYENYDGVKTHFSQSDSYLERAILFDARVGWKFAPFPALVIEPFAAYKYLDIKWSAQNGYYQYPPETSAPYTPWSPSEPKVPLSGIVLTYDQTFMIPAVGIRVIGRVSRTLSLDASFALSPFAALNDIDEHPLRYLAFYDSMAGGFYLEPELAVSWQAARDLELSLRLSYVSISEPNTGTTVMVDTNPNDAQYGIPTLLTSQYSGATFSAFGAELGGRLRL